MIVLNQLNRAKFLNLWLEQYQLTTSLKEPLTKEEKERQQERLQQVTAQQQELITQAHD